MHVIWGGRRGRVAPFSAPKLGRRNCTIIYLLTNDNSPRECKHCPQLGSALIADPKGKGEGQASTADPQEGEGHAPTMNHTAGYSLHCEAPSAKGRACTHCRPPKKEGHASIADPKTGNGMHKPYLGVCEVGMTSVAPQLLVPPSTLPGLLSFLQYNACLQLPVQCSM